MPIKPELACIDSVIVGDCVPEMYKLPAKSIDVIFADPPYNLQLQTALYRPNQSKVHGVSDPWDQFLDFKHYDLFTYEWLHACQYLLKDTGTIWVIGSYHNIYRVGTLMMDLGYWILNDFIWIKANPMPNFRGVRFTNAHETLIWAKKSKEQGSYTFNYHAMKALNKGKQARSDWFLPICSGAERLTHNDGTKLHATQKPEALLERVLLASTKVGDVVLDPFFGTGTTGAVAKRWHRHWIGIEQDSHYAEAAKKRIANVTPKLTAELSAIEELDAPKQKIAFRELVSNEIVPSGSILRHRKTNAEATVLPDGNVIVNGISGSIHKVGAVLAKTPACNGWQMWLLKGEDGNWYPLDQARQEYFTQ